jgi:undecaprenyl-diphosphatase
MNLLLQSAEKRAALAEEAVRGTAPSARFSFPPERMLVAACLALLAFAVLLAYAFDEPLLRLLHRATNADNAAFWRGVSWLGSGLALTPVVAAIALVLAWLNRTRSALVLAFGWAATSVTVEWMKWLVDRGRPSVTPWTLARGDSFPSGHAALSLYVFLHFALSFLASESRNARPARSLRKGGLILLASVPVAVGLSRVTLGVHWPSDVAAGWAVGLFFCALTRALQEDWN